MVSFDNHRELHVGRPNLGNLTAFHQRLERVLETRRLTNGGPMVQAFEQRLCEMSGTLDAVATSNATTGLQMAARAVGLRPGDEVIMPSFTWVATAHAFEWIGLVPVFCDVYADTGNIDPDSVQALIGSRTRAIVGVHAFGRAVDVAPLQQLARERNLALLFDAAHAFGSQVNGRAVGSSGSAEVFSFHATKFAHSFEGGAVVTNDRAVGQDLRQLRDMGMDPTRHVRGPGTVARMSEVHAAMGLTSLGAMEEIIEHNHRIHALYERLLAGIDGISFLSTRGGPGNRNNAQYVVIRVAGADAARRDAVFDHLLRDQIRARKYFFPGCHRIPPYVDAPGRHMRTELAVTEQLSHEVLVLPTGTDIGARDVERVCARIQECLPGEWDDVVVLPSRPR